MNDYDNEVSSPCMLKTKVLHEILNEAHSSDIVGIVLMTLEGSLVAYTNRNTDEDSTSSAAIASNIWSSYVHLGQMVLYSDDLDMIMIDGKDGQVVISNAANMLLCIFAKPSAAMGLIKAKAQILCRHLDKPLRSLKQQG
ncbi:Ragulator complex protein LAMTOR2 [Trichoplax sp. H2]|uniref:Roadblock/LAMTOR2 domain-containing protein n=1 Tax=Trichoplax adhaerens TaxID=10228 RepID=B3RN00_TRIAD|nr:hypothetical protein TRIADDRAFT_52985 [Trichoplax adhaerens]EDV27369.1 hypothetical protein TRIADDRAFT_52985 [Trichoplax adhaerens]RDD39876.1 Ragulator complex protein LAMTOR2 [Trichoplax sp. H2]|eukprot:XP_002109203.1 hypothetical protein TRIADDRAFT_52985 [Trichoplax adhaerens]